MMGAPDPAGCRGRLEVGWGCPSPLSPSASLRVGPYQVETLHLVSNAKVYAATICSGLRDT